MCGFWCEIVSLDDHSHTHTHTHTQGFWDMVYFQVEDVEKKFEHLSELEKNGWKERAQKPKGRKTKVESDTTL